MRIFSLACMLAVFMIADTVSGDVTIGNKSTFNFATAEEGAKLIREKDDFVRALGAFDRSARLKTDKEVSEKTFLDFAAKAATAWPPADQEKVQSALEAIAPKLELLTLPLPKKATLVRTTGVEEGHVAYTRGTTIFLPPEELTRNPGLLQGTLAHEMFHIVSRANPALRDRTYAAIGFVKCNEVPFPDTLIARKITNPDAPRNDHYIRLLAAGKPILAIPVLVSTAAKYDVRTGGEIFDYAAFRWLVVEAGSDGVIRPQPKGNDLQLLEMNQVAGFYEQVGRNTNYTIHPEEILAENFKLMIMGAQGLASPEVTDNLRKALLGEPFKTPAAPLPAATIPATSRAP